MKKKNPVSAETRRENLLCGIASVLFPTSILCYFCAQNVGEFVALWLIFFMLGALIVLATLAYCVALLILRRGFLALVFSVICWIGCYLEPPIKKTFFDGLDMSNTRRLLYTAALILAVAVPVVYLVSRLKRDTHKPILLFLAFSALILVLNLLPIVRAVFAEDIGPQTESQLYQADFFVDLEKTDMPNVYWIHPDGMTSVDVVAKYFHEDQSEFLSDLAERGFSVNPSAHFEAGAKTNAGIPALTCPYAYDTWLSSYATTHEAMRQALATYTFAEKLRDVRYHNEMIAAFGKKGYGTNVISSPGEVYYYPLIGGAFYSFLDEVNEVEIPEPGIEKQMLLQNMRINLEEVSGFLRQVFERLYRMIFIVPPSRWIAEFTVDHYGINGTNRPFTAIMPEEQVKQVIPSDYAKHGVHDRKMVRSLYDILYGGSQDPKLVVIHSNIAHFPFIIDENGMLAKDDEESMDPLGYYPQHAYSAKVLTDMIDMILAVDPDAVIVIQADHGLHGNTEQDFKTAFGEDADASELWNGTMSAIRVPEKYQTGEEHYTMENPLNLSRYLVNSFVGKNYEYLPAN